MVRRAAVALLVAALLVAGAACGSGGSSEDGDSGARLRVVAAFAPLAWMAERVGGDRVDVRSLTGSGQEPHDLELAPRQVAEVIDADAVVYLRGFQPAVDDAVDQAADEHVFDAAGHADLLDAEGGGTDPHFWLDPVRFVAVTHAFAAFMVERDPVHALDYRVGSTKLVAYLLDLDARLRSGLESCARKELVTSHAAFAYFAARYGLDQVSISGSSPEAEPSPARIAEVSRFVEQHDVRTIYSETLVPPDLVDAVASETGVRTAVLDPVEGITKDSVGDDYLAVMRGNLASVRKGQPCT